MSTISNSTDPHAKNIMVVETCGQCLPKGYLKGQSSWAKLGFNADVGATEETLAPQGGVYSFLNASSVVSAAFRGYLEG